MSAREWIHSSVRRVLVGGWECFGISEAYIIVHDGCTEQEYSRVVGPLELVDVAAILCCMGSIIEVVIVIHHLYFLCPIERLFGPLRIAVIASIQSQTSTKVEEASIRDGILVIVSGIEGEDLPSQATVAILCVPSFGLSVENSLRKR